MNSLKIAIELSDLTFSNRLKLQTLNTWMSKFNTQLNEIVHSDRKNFRSISSFILSGMEWQGFNKNQIKTKTIRFIGMEMEMIFVFFFRFLYAFLWLRLLRWVDSKYYIRHKYHKIILMDSSNGTHGSNKIRHILSSIQFLSEYFQFHFHFHVIQQIQCMWVWVCVESTADFNTVNFVTWKTWAIKFKYLINLTLLQLKFSKWINRKKLVSRILNNVLHLLLIL